MLNSSVYCKQIAHLVAWDSSCAAASGAQHTERPKSERQKADKDNIAQLTVKSSYVRHANMQTVALTLCPFLSRCDVGMQRQALAHTLFLARARCVLNR